MPVQSLRSMPHDLVVRSAQPRFRDVGGQNWLRPLYRNRHPSSKMAYDLHIVRTEDWTQSASAPITEQDINALIAADAELAWSTTSHIDLADDAGALTRYYAITWRGKPCFLWYRNQIQCSGPDEAQILKLVQMSRVLNAHVVGDDGEIYPLEQQPATTILPIRRMASLEAFGRGISFGLHPSRTEDSVCRNVKSGRGKPWSSSGRCPKPAPRR